MKNIRISKKLLSMLTAGVIMATPAMAHTEEVKENNNNDNEFTLIMQEQDFTPLGIDEFCADVESSYKYLTQFINYDGLQNDLQCLYYLVNRGYMPKEEEEDLITSGIVFETDFSKNKYENFMRAYSLINVILDYNQSMIRNTEDSNALIDVSKLCYSEFDAKLLHEMHMNYFNAYKNGRYYNKSFEDNSYYEMVFKQLTTLNAAEKAGNGVEVSTGAEWLALNVIGGDVMQMLRDDMSERYSRKELDKYFNKQELNKQQWILREDISLDLNRCVETPDLESEVVDFAQLWVFVYDNVNNNIMKTFQIDCTKSK